MTPQFKRYKGYFTYVSVHYNENHKKIKSTDYRRYTILERNKGRRIDRTNEYVCVKPQSETMKVGYTQDGYAIKRTI